MIPRDKHILMLQRMMRIRFFENKLIECQKAGEIVGALHTYTGEEGVAVGACVALNDDDYIAGNHRSHGHPIAKGEILIKQWRKFLVRKMGIVKAKEGQCI